MSIHNLAVKDDTEYGDGEDGGEYSGWYCEDCGAGEFALKAWLGQPQAVCIECHKPQDSVTWIYLEVE